jgi:1,3-beta-glucan synthase component
MSTCGQVRYRKRKRGPQPVACVGCREWIFSENSGALASFAAATEFTFGTIVQVGKFLILMPCGSCILRGMQSQIRTRVKAWS